MAACFEAECGSLPLQLLPGPPPATSSVQPAGDTALGSECPLPCGACSQRPSQGRDTTAEPGSALRAAPGAHSPRTSMDSFWSQTPSPCAD